MHRRNAIIESAIVLHRCLKAQGFIFDLSNTFGTLVTTPVAIMPQANGNVSPERFIEPQPQRQSAVQIAIKNFSPVWCVPASLICCLIERSFLPDLILDVVFTSAQVQ
jgi:hypothetical protein